ncbi:uncharacterized protein [Diadema antillarum]|uniref:uncharacterized protein n=1 Tax=Diadema antillarum TaxID=105358 RepID=UPI003A8649D3
MRSHNNVLLLHGSRVDEQQLKYTAQQNDQKAENESLKHQRQKEEKFPVPSVPRFLSSRNPSLRARRLGPPPARQSSYRQQASNPSTAATSASIPNSGQVSECPEDNRQRHVTELPDVVIVGDSMIKHIDGRLLSRRRKVFCHPHPGAKVADISAKKVTEGVKAKGDVILHIGSNNVSHGNGSTSTADDITALADGISNEGCEVALSSIVHRRWESAHQRRLVDRVNERLHTAARERSWGFIDNSSIGDRHLGRDGVHINKAGQAVLASNMRNFIRRPREQPTASSQQRSYAEVVRPKDTFLAELIILKQIL